MGLYESLLERMNGREYNGYFSIVCIFHNDSHPSLMVYLDGFRCVACGKHGTLSYLDKCLGSRFMPSRNNTVSNVSPSWRKWGDTLDEIADKAHTMLKRYPQFQGYYKKRKVENFIETGFLGYVGGWSIIPVFDTHKKVIDIVARAVKGKGDTRYTLRPSEVAVRPLFCPNWVRVQEAEQIYVVYVMFDAISLELCGLPVVTGITGKSLNADQLKPLRKRFIILPDYHEEEDAHKLANSLGWRAKAKKLNYPESCKDVDEVRVKYGNEYLLDMIGAS